MPLIVTNSTEEEDWKRPRWSDDACGVGLRAGQPAAHQRGMDHDPDIPRYARKGQTHQPDDEPEPGDRRKYCGEHITWTGPGPYDWQVT